VEQDGVEQDGVEQDGGTPQENVVVVVLDGPETPTDPVLDALTEPGGGFAFRSAAVVRRDTEGAVTIGEHAGDIDTEGTLAERHPRIAGLLTALLAPVDTLLLGNSLVALTGALAEPSPDERVLLQLARAIPAGGTAVIADVVETDPQALDQRLAGHAATVTRHPLADVEADLADPPPSANRARRGAAGRPGGGRRTAARRGSERAAGRIYRRRCRV
jgi:Protein of unknown function (DUF1269)